MRVRSGAYAGRAQPERPTRDVVGPDSGIQRREIEVLCESLHRRVGRLTEPDKVQPKRPSAFKIPYAYSRFQAQTGIDLVKIAQAIEFELRQLFAD